MFFTASLAVFGLVSALGAPPPTIHLTANALNPSTTFEARFDCQMVADEMVGKTAPISPLEFRPALQGKFTWLDHFRGVFKPTEPPGLDTAYTVSLTDGTADAKGEPLPDSWSKTLETPAMEIENAFATAYFWGDEFPANAAVRVEFNTNVSPEIAAPYLKFVSREGTRVAARVTTPTTVNSSRNLYHRQGGNWNATGWQTQFLVANGITVSPEKARKNQLLATPEHILPPGSEWKLVVEKGLPSSEEPTALRESLSISLGDVRRFEVRKVVANNLVSGRIIDIRFSRPFARAAEEIASCISVDPTPADLKIEPAWDQVQLSGKFAVDQEYTVTVNPKAHATDGTPLDSVFTQAVTFTHIPPRLYFEDFSVHQLASGGRQFHLLSVNLPAVQVTAKLIRPDAVPLALQAWDSYHRSWNEIQRDDDEPYRKVDAEKIPGHICFDKDLTIDAATDETKELTLDWNEILGAGHTGAVLLIAEEQYTPGAEKKRHPAVQALVQITDLGVVWKSSRHETFLYVFSLATGRAIEGAKLEFRDEKNTVLSTAETDVNGIARLPANEALRWVLVRKADDVNLIDYTYSDEISLGRYHVDVEGVQSREDEEELDDTERKVFLFTERDVYRPGETVHMKGIVRDYASNVRRIPAGEKLHLEMKDARDRSILDRVITLSDSGAFDTDVTISGNTVGSYKIEVQPATPPTREEDVEYYAQKVIQVQEFVPNAFEITLPRTGAFMASERVQLPISAQYYMGKPLQHAHLKWTVRAQDTGFTPEGFDDFTFCDGIQDYRLRKELDRISEFTEQGEAELAEGHTTVAVKIPVNAKAPQPRSGSLLCGITDVDQQTVSSGHNFTVHSSDFYLGIRDLPDVVREGAPLPLEVIAVDRNGHPMSDPIDATLKITRVNWQTNRIEGANASADYENEPRFEVVGAETIKTARLTKTGHDWRVSEDGKPVSHLIAGKPGQYLVQASAKDAEGRDVLTTITLCVYGETDTVWNYRNPFQIDLAPDRESYQVGQTATLLVKTPISGNALVTVERENVRRSFVTHLQGNAPSIEVPLEDEDAPNVYVSVMLLRGANASTHGIKKPEYRVGYASLTVERPEAKLSVYVRPDAPAHEPGDPASIEAEVVDYQGKPVSGAELTLYAVDEGVLSLTDYTTPDLYEFFYAKRALDVRTGLTLPQLLTEDPDERDFANKGFLVGDGGGTDRIRKNFLACAFWAATVKTGENGRATANFITPDGLTRYRLIAVAQTKKDQFGSAESSFEVNKPFMLEPAPPRFANVGDKLLLRAVLHNTTDLDGEAEVRIKWDETVSAERDTCRVKLPAQGSVAVDFPVEFTHAGEAKWTWSARFASGDGNTSYRDAAEVKLKVEYPTPARHEIHLMRVDGTEAKLLDGIAPDLLEGTGSVQVSIANSRIVDLGEAVRYLFHYPYGCVEQTTSSTLPWLAARSLRKVLPDLKKSDAEIERAVEHGINRLLTMQTESGGLAYWPGEQEPLLWASAYGGLGLALAKRAGYAVPEAEFNRVCEYMSQRLRGSSHLSNTADFSDRCLALYTLAVAGKPEDAYQEWLFEQRDKLSAENRALLALAIAESDGPRSMIEGLLDPQKPAPVNSDDFHWFGSPSRMAALRLLAWCRYQPKDADVDRCASDLFGLAPGGHWNTTQGNAWAILALAEYADKVEGLSAESSGTIHWGAETQTFALSDKARFAEVTWPLTATAAQVPLEISNPDGKPLFASVCIESHPKFADTPEMDNGYSVTRTYYRVDDERHLTPLDQPKVGDRVLVQLRVHVHQDAEYVAINDPLPAVLEAIHPEFKTDATDEKSASLETERGWYDNYHELREDRALFFRDYVGPGDYVIRYLARVRAAGTAIAPATRVEEMYHPERFGQSDSIRITTQPLN